MVLKQLARSHIALELRDPSAAEGTNWVRNFLSVVGSQHVHGFLTRLERSWFSQFSLEIGLTK